MTIRIDEFGSPSTWDGALDSADQTRFMLFGFDQILSAPINLYRELMCFDSQISRLMEFDSDIGSVCNG